MATWRLLRHVATNHNRPFAEVRVMPEFDPTVEYRDVPNFPGYLAGSDGSVWSCRRIKKRQLTPVPTKFGYVRVGMYRDGKLVFKRVHHVILEAFVGPRPAGLVACHDPDSDKRNNRLDNLRWDTQSSNMLDVFRVRREHGIPNKKVNQGSRHAMSKLTDADVVEIRRMHASGVKSGEIAKLFGMCRSHISRIVHRVIWKHI